MTSDCNVCDNRRLFIGKRTGPSRRVDRDTGKANRVKVINGYYILDENVVKSMSVFYSKCTFIYL